jgi:hypothetical protein
MSASGRRGVRDLPLSLVPAPLRRSEKADLLITSSPIGGGPRVEREVLELPLPDPLKPKSSMTEGLPSFERRSLGVVHAYGARLVRHPPPTGEAIADRDSAFSLHLAPDQALVRPATSRAGASAPMSPISSTSTLIRSRARPSCEEVLFPLVVVYSYLHYRLYSISWR